VWLGYISSVFYLSSRLSQIYKNYMRKCTEGLSVAMFLMAISANVRTSRSMPHHFCHHTTTSMRCGVLVDMHRCPCR
jgi:PQ loop repeat